MYSKEATAWRAEPLPRGRHKLDRDAVHASQRERLLRAMLQCVAADGYAATSVPRVAAAARVSPNTFYKHFTDKADCFLALCDAESRELLAAVTASGSMREAIRVYLAWWRARPESSRAYLLELPAAGERAQQQRREAHARFAATLGGGVRAQVVVAGITELVAAEVAAGRLERLGELEDALVTLIGDV